MGKLADYMASKRAKTPDFEHELRAVRDLLHGVTQLGGASHTIDLSAKEGAVAGGAARAAFVEALRAALHEALLKYAHDLAHEALESGIDQHAVSVALSGGVVAEAVAARAESVENARAERMEEESVAA